MSGTPSPEREQCCPIGVSGIVSIGNMCLLTFSCNSSDTDTIKPTPPPRGRGQTNSCFHCIFSWGVLCWVVMCPRPGPTGFAPWPRLRRCWTGDCDPAVMSLFRQPQRMALSSGAEQWCHFPLMLEDLFFFFFQRKIKCLRTRLFFAAVSPPPSGVWFVPAPQRCRRALTGTPVPMGKTPDADQGCCALGCWSSRRLSVRHHLSTCSFCSCEWKQWPFPMIL